MQHGLLFHTLRAPESGIYVNCSELMIEGELDRAAMEFAWQRVVLRHQALRCSFFWEGLSKPVQAVHKRVTMPVEWLETSDELREPHFDLRYPPQMSVTVIRIGRALHRLVWNRHHILFDGWSQAILLREVFQFYEAFCLVGDKFDEDRLAGASVPFENYVRWLRQQPSESSEKFWRSHLRAFRHPTAIAVSPMSMGLPGVQREISITVDAVCVAMTESFAKQRSLTVSTIHIAAWAVVAGSAACERDVVFGLTVAGRPASMSGAESIVGLFINTLPIRALLLADVTFATLTIALQQQQVSLTEHQHTPLIDIQRWSEIQRGDALFESIVVIGNYPADFAGLQVSSRLLVSSVLGEVKNNYPLTLRIMPGSNPRVSLLFDTARVSGERAEFLLNAWLRVLRSVVSRPAAKIDELISEIGQEGSERWQTGVPAGRI
jgi:hypothetical protein